MAQQYARAPFSSYPSTPSQMTYAGPMSYNAAMHGSASSFPSGTPFPALLDPATLPPDPSYYDISVATHKQIASLQAKLDQKLGPEYISQRPGPGGGPKLTYAEGWKIINLANEVFGFNGWSSSISSLTVDYLDPHDEGRRWNCGVSAIVRVTLRDGVYHEDVGYGVADNVRSKGAALDKCKKEAVTDGIKRTLRNFGNLLGNCLYDKQYTQEIVKIKVQPPKFDRDALHRRREFEQGGSGAGGTIKAEAGAAPAKVSDTHGDAKASTVLNSVNNARSMPPPPVPPQHARGNPSVQPKVEPATPTSVPHPPPQPRPRPVQPSSATPSARAPVSVPQPGPPLPPSDPTTPHSHNQAQLHSTDVEEASYFNSDDDALYMQLDMSGVGSLQLEEDRPIHAEYDDEGGSSAQMSRSNSMHEDFATGASDAYQAPHDGDTANLQPQPQPQHVKQHRSAPHPQPHPQQVQQHRPPHQPNQNVQPGQPKPQHQPRLAQATSTHQQPHQQSHQQHQQHQHQHQHQHQRPPHPHQPLRQVQTSNSAPSRSPTPSSAIGGFHFPPGVGTSSRPSNNEPRPSAVVPGASSSAQIVGMKRGVDAMNSGAIPGRARTSTSNAAPQRQGQVYNSGQSNQSNNANGNAKHREPLAPLNLDEGGDVKRVRR